MLSRRFEAIGTLVVDHNPPEDAKWTSYQAETRIGAVLLAELYNTANEEDEQRPDRPA